MASTTSKFFPSRIIQRPAPEAVIYNLTSTTSTRITLPMGSTWSSGLHWHNTHTEYLRLIQGSIRVVLGSAEHTITARPDEAEEDQIVLIVEKGVQHEWSRAAIDDGIDVIVEESTEPRDGMKTVFFWAVNAVVLEGIERIKGSRTGLGAWIEEWLLWWKLMIVFWELDNWPVFGGRYFAQSLHTFTVLSVAGWLGWACGTKVIRKDIMPEDAWELWTKRHEVKAD
jgi:hypothetical protein